MGQLPVVRHLSLDDTVTCVWTGILIGDMLREIQGCTTGDIYNGTYVISRDKVEIWIINCNETWNIHLSNPWRDNFMSLSLSCCGREDLYWPCLVIRDMSFWNGRKSYLTWERWHLHVFGGTVTFAMTGSERAVAHGATDDTCYATITCSERGLHCWDIKIIH